MVTDEGNEELDLSAGMVPHHNLGPVTGYDHDSGLPIVKRKSADTQSAETKPSNPAPKPEASETKPAKPETESPAAETKPEPNPADTLQTHGLKPAGGKPGLTPAKGAPVKLRDGTAGKIAYLDQATGHARVKTEDGKNVTARKGTFEVQPHVQVAAHIRKIPGKE